MIALIGYGRFGALTLKHLAGDNQVVVHTRSENKKEDIAQAGGRWVPLDEACSADAVVLCVPISAMQTTLRAIAPRLSPGSLVVDVCSVKVYPVQWMTALLPDQVEILATHPMFGPDSAANALTGHKIVLCPVRLAPQRFYAIKNGLREKGLTVIETSPDEHDRQIADSLALTHFIGRSLCEYGAAPLAIDTEGYKRLLHILEVVTNDTWQLFEDMNRFNPYARDKRRRLMQALAAIDTRLEENKNPGPENGP